MKKPWRCWWFGHTADWENPEYRGVILLGWRTGVSRYRCDRCDALFWRDHFRGIQIDDDDPRLTPL